MEIDNGTNTKVVNSNRLQHGNVSTNTTTLQSNSSNAWDQTCKPRTIDHVYVPPPAATVPQCYPQQQHHALDRYGF